MNKILIPTLLLSLMLLTGCLKPPHDINHSTVVRADGQPMSMEEMEHAIRRAAYLEDWHKLDLLEPGHMVATRTSDDGEEIATVDILYTPGDFSIHYKSSQGLRYDALNGVIGPRYQTMVGDLADRIDEVVGELGKTESH